MARRCGSGESTATGFNSDEAVYAGQAAALAGDPELSRFFPIFRAHPMLFQFILSIMFRIEVSDVAARHPDCGYRAGDYLPCLQTGAPSCTTSGPVRLPRCSSRSCRTTSSLPGKCFSMAADLLHNPDAVSGGAVCTLPAPDLSLRHGGVRSGWSSLPRRPDLCWLPRFMPFSR